MTEPPASETELDPNQKDVQEPELPPLIIPQIRSEKIYIFLGSFYLIMILIRVFFVHGPSLFSLFKYFAKPGMATPPASGSILLDFFIYMCVACQFFPIPTLPPIAFMAKLFHPILISVVGALGTSIANLNDYAILGWLFRSHRVARIRDVRTYRKFLHFFDRYAFLTMAAGSFLPIPIDVVRLMAISRAYSYWKYFAATFVGRVPRYLLIAYLGKELPVKYILYLFLLSILPAVYKIISGMIKKGMKK
jgi:membrane protein YqaA with SNARE-associated domain